MTTALLIIDLQNDFISGSMGLPKSEEIVPLINDLRSCNWVRGIIGYITLKYIYFPLHKPG